MRWTFRVAAAGVAALVLACLWRPAVKAGGGIPEGGKKVDPVRPGPRPKPKIISLTAAAKRKAERMGIVVKRKRLRAAQVVPKNALFYVAAPDVSRLAVAAKDLALAKMLSEKAIGEQFDAYVGRLRRSSGGVRAKGLAGLLQTVLGSKVNLDVVTSAIRKEFALVGLPPIKEGGGGIRVAAVAACGTASQRALAEAMETIIGELHARNPGAYEPIPEEHGGAEVRGLRLEGLDLFYAFYENLFLVGTGKDTVAEMINTNLDGPERQLAGDSAFRAAEEGLGRGAAVFYRVDMKGVLSGLGPIVAAAAGGSLVGTISGAVYLDGEAIRERIETKVPAGRRPGIKPGEPLATPPKSIDYFSIDTVLYAATSVDSLEDIVDVAKDPQTALAMQQLTQLAEAAGVDVARDIAPGLSAFGGEVAAGLILPHGRPAEVLVVLEVKKKSLLGRAEDAVKKLVGGQMKTVNYRKVDILYAEPPENPEEATGLQLVLPTLSCARVGHSLFMVASSRRAMEKAIRQRSFQPSCLREKEDYVRCLGGLKPRRTSILYVDAKRCVEAVRSPLISPSGAELPTGLEGSLLVSALERNLFGLGFVSGESGESAFMESCGPVGPVTGAGLGTLALLQNAFGEASADAPMADAENLTRIGVAIHLYATDFDRFPARLSELYDEYMDDLKYFMTPGAPRDVRSKDDINAHCDYIYVRGLSPADLSDSIIAFSGKPMHGPKGKGRNVLRLNGKVDFSLESDIEDLVKANPGK